MGVGWRNLASVMALLASALVPRAGAADLLPVPPASLVFGDAAVAARVVSRRPVEARSGGWRLQLVSADRLSASGAAPARLRLMLLAKADRGVLPAGLEITSQPFVLDGRPQLVPALDWRLAYAADSTAWVAVYLPAGTARLSALGIALGVPAQAAELVVPLTLSALGTPQALDQLDLAVEPTLMRRESVELDISPEGPPYFYALESTARRPVAAAPAGASYFSLRLHTLGPEPAPGDWELSDLRLPESDGLMDQDWRFIRRPWRPDWGGWFGAVGTDQVGADGSGGVRLDEVEADSPAFRAGLRAGDVVTALDGEASTDAYTLGRLVRRHAPGAACQVNLLRAGKRLVMPLQLGRAPLWPDRDDAEFEAVWSRLSTLRAGGGPGDVLNAWDWQARRPVPTSFEPTKVEMVFTRQELADATTFLLRDVPLMP